MATLWRNRSFNLLWAGQTVNGLGSAVSTVAIPLVAVEQLDASPFGVGVLTAAEWLPALFVGLLAGVWVDRHRRRATMMWAAAGQAIAMAIVPAVAQWGHLTMPVLLASAGLCGLFGVFFRTAYSPYLRDVVPKEDLARANAKLRSSRSVANICGPALGGALVQLIGAARAVGADAVSFLVACLCVSRIDTKEAAPSRTSGDTSLWSAIAEGVAYLARARLLRAVTLSLAAINFLLTAAGAVEIYFLVREIGLSADAIGVVLAVGSIGGLAGAFVAGGVTDRFGYSLAATGSLCLTAPFGLLMACAGHGPAVSLFAVGLFVLTFGLAISTVAFATLRQLASSPAILGRVSATSDVLMSASMPLGAVIGGALGSWVGVRAALFVIVAALSLLGLGLTIGRPLASSDTAAEHPVTARTN
ncbi:MFS transporter [Leekyejoonella antrihumi]|uniref:MFS transporter n=1 Tax=Leekyejoonella antrihumi TaxID=1660198 RepID=A0A563DR56_9MICO|nr:MFS transporter [Leekyejoonella antrihumi]TWP32737.1 MFS transporter [Leekyejoonella antrihumi]